MLCCGLLSYPTYGQPVATAGVSIPVPSVTVEIRTTTDFYEPLSPHGEWVVIGSYGRCWRPAGVEAGWRPYCNGKWQMTDAGWYWVSDEPWAWATYHYGRWNFAAESGWYWVPQIQWAPAWVSWHSGGGYVGWAPLFPYGVRVISPQAYVFVEERNFMEPVRLSTVVADNTTVISRIVAHEAPANAVVEKATGRKVEAVPAQELRHQTEAAVVSKQSYEPCPPTLVPLSQREAVWDACVTTGQQTGRSGRRASVPTPRNDRKSWTENQESATTASDPKSEAKSGRQ